MFLTKRLELAQLLTLQNWSVYTWFKDLIPVTGIVCKFVTELFRKPRKQHDEKNFKKFWSDYFIPSWRKNCYRLWSQIFSCNVKTITHLDEKLIFGRSSWVFQTLEEFRSQCFLQLEGRQFILKGCRLASDAHKITTGWLRNKII